LEISLFKTLGQIAGIGGVSLGVFFLLLSYFIRKNIFPKLSKGKAYRLIRQFQYLTFGIAVIGMGVWLYGGLSARQVTAVYRVRVTVLSDGSPIDNATVWSTVGGEAKRVSGGYEIVIPKSTIPTNGTLTLFAEVQSAFLRGKKEINLADDFNPAIILELTHDISASVRGLVQDQRGKVLSNVRISLPGYGDEGVITSASGSFVLPAHVSVGQQVEIHAEKAGYKPIDQWHPAGNDSAILVLEKNR
jgi:hypothetical protein